MKNKIGCAEWWLKLHYKAFISNDEHLEGYSGWMAK